MRKVSILLCALAAVTLWGTVSAQDTPVVAPATDQPQAPATGPSATELEMKAKLERAETALDAATRRIGELEVKVDGLSAQVGAASKDVSGVSAQLKDLEAKAAAPGVPAAAPMFKVTPYGYVKVDVAYDDAATASSDATAWVNSEKAGFGSDRQFTITARQTRVGLNIAGPEVDGYKNVGKVEADFYGTGANETKPELMLRQAYWQVSKDNWRVLAGQTWEPLAPLFPGTINYPAAAFQGNIGHRKPLIWYGRTDKLCKGELTTDVAAVRHTGSSVFSSSTLDDQASDAGWPVVEARTAWSVPTAIGRPMTIGISGHVGQEEYDQVTLVAGPPASLRTVSGKGDMFMTYSGCVDWMIPVCKVVDVSGEVFGGRNLDAFMGGINQGVNNGTTQGTTTFASALNKPIDAFGGWAQVCYKPTAKWAFMAGAGIDDPANDDLSGAINKSSNKACFVNGWYMLNEKAKVGAEVMYMKTDYMGAPDGDNIRVQGAAQYSF